MVRLDICQGGTMSDVLFDAWDDGSAESYGYDGDERDAIRPWGV